MPRIYLNVPFAEKDEAKRLGARWDAERKLWYTPDGVDNSPFARWFLVAGGGTADMRVNVPRAPGAHCPSCKAALFGPVRFCPYCAQKQPDADIAPAPNTSSTPNPTTPPPLPATPPMAVPPPLPPAATSAASPPPAPAPAATPPAPPPRAPTPTPAAPPAPPARPAKKRGCLAYFGYFLLALSAFVLYTCFKPDPYGAVEKYLKKDDLNRAFQEWKTISPTAQDSAEGVLLRATLRKRFVTTSVACEAACNVGCARAYAEALSEIVGNAQDAELAAAEKRVKTIEAQLQKVESVAKEVDRNLVSAANKFVILKKSNIAQSCVPDTLDEKIATRLTTACEKCRTHPNPRACAITLQEAGGGIANGTATQACNTILAEVEDAMGSATTPRTNAGAGATSSPIESAIDAVARAIEEATRLKPTTPRTENPNTNAPSAAREAPPPARTTPPPPATATPPRASTPPPATATTRVIYKDQPAFPAEATRRGVTSGRVQARMSINAQGRVTNVTIIESTPPRVFDRAATQALSNWRFNLGADDRRHEVEINFNSEP